MHRHCHAHKYILTLMLSNMFWQPLIKHMLTLSCCQTHWHCHAVKHVWYHHASNTLALSCCWTCLISSCIKRMMLSCYLTCLTSSCIKHVDIAILFNTFDIIMHQTHVDVVMLVRAIFVWGCETESVWMCKL